VRESVVGISLKSCSIEVEIKKPLGNGIIMVLCGEHGCTICRSQRS